MKFILKYKQLVILQIFVWNSFLPIFGQIESNNGCDSILLINSTISCWPNLTKNNQIVEFSDRGDTMTIFIIEEISNTTDAHGDTVTIGGFRTTSSKKQMIKITKEKSKKIDIIIIKVVDSLRTFTCEKYTFIKKRKNNSFKIIYSEKKANDNRNDCILPKNKFKFWIRRVFFNK